MQRQAVPLINCQTPLVGTGIECELGSLEGAVVNARTEGIVEYVSGRKDYCSLGSRSYWRSRMAFSSYSYLLFKEICSLKP